EINATVRIQRNSPARQAGGFRSLEHRSVLPGAQRNGARGESLGTAHYCLGNGFGGRACEDDLLRLSTSQSRNGTTAGFDHVAQGAAVSMDRGWIACQLERSKQRCPRFGTKRGRGIMIKIDRRSRHCAFRALTAPT